MRRSDFSAWDPWRIERRPLPRRPVVFEPPRTEAAPRAPEPEPPEPAAPRPAPREDAAALKYAMDELEAVKARVERDRQRVLDDTRFGVLEQLLPILDNLDRSIDAGAGGPDAALLAGIEAVRSQFEGVLAKHGLERIESVGQLFDPAVHDAIAVLDVDDPSIDGTVADEWRRGYRLGGHTVRAPQVRVARVRS